MLGCSRQAINCTLGKLREAGLISLRTGAIRVLDRQGLLQQGEAGR
ncbi:MAG: helix-turn-helix domain-containing protein [Paracoccus sp. (in: a-proteobacteria)]